MVNLGFELMQQLKSSSSSKLTDLEKYWFKSDAPQLLISFALIWKKKVHWVGILPCTSSPEFSNWYIALEIAIYHSCQCDTALKKMNFCIGSLYYTKKVEFHWKRKPAIKNVDIKSNEWAQLFTSAAGVSTTA